MTLVQAFPVEISRVFDKEMIFQHFLGHERRKKSFVLLSGNLGEVRLLSCYLFEFFQDTRRSVVVLSRQDAGAQYTIAVFDDAVDKFSWPKESITEEEGNSEDIMLDLPTDIRDVNQGEFSVLSYRVG